MVWLMTRTLFSSVMVEMSVPWVTRLSSFARGWEWGVAKPQGPMTPMAMEEPVSWVTGKEARLAVTMVPSVWYVSLSYL